MQFALENVTSHGARLGKILFREGRAAVETPLCLLYTRGGAVPHMADDLLTDIQAKPPATMLCLPHLYELPGTEVISQYKLGIHSFLTAQEQLLYLSVQDPCAPPPPGYNEQKNVTVWTNGGRKKLTVSDHLSFVEACRPTVFESLCDSAPATGSHLKRVRKSVDRTLRFLDETLTARSDSEALRACSVLGAVVGGDTEEERRRSALETARRPVDGFVLEGFDLPHDKDFHQSLLLSTTRLLPADKPRFVHGMESPADIFTAVECGVDVFDGSYPYSATDQGRAIVFPVFRHSVSTPTEEGSGREGGVLTGGGRETDSSGGECMGVPGVMELDLREERYASDFTPVLPGCPCYCCRHHSRAYIHHLLTTHEILASVLLMLHNLSHYLLFFHCLRHALQTANYPAFKRTCLSLAMEQPTAHQ